MIKLDDKLKETLNKYRRFTKTVLKSRRDEIFIAGVRGLELQSSFRSDIPCAAHKWAEKIRWA
jgi:hypothetical protein